MKIEPRFEADIARDLAIQANGGAGGPRPRRGGMTRLPMSACARTDAAVAECRETSRNAERAERHDDIRSRSRSQRSNRAAATTPVGRWHRRAVVAAVAAMTMVSMLAARLGPPDERMAAAVFGPTDPTALRHGDALASDGSLVAIASPRDGDDANERATVSLGQLVHDEPGRRPHFAFEAEATESRSGEHFGCSVAVRRIGSGSEDPRGSLSLCAIGADNARGAHDATGAVELFRRVEPPATGHSHGVWLRETRLLSTCSEPGDRFGHSVALGGSTAAIVAIGAPYADSPALLDSGAVHIFRRAARAAETAPPDEPVAASPTTFDDLGGQADLPPPGATMDGAIWLEHAVLRSPAPATSAHFGVAVALWGDLVAVAAPDLRVGAASGSGAVYIFEFEAEGCRLVAELLPPALHPWQWFGAALALDGTTLAVGVPGGRRASDGVRCGRVELYDLATLLEAPARATAARTTIELPFLEAGASFGASLAMRGAVLAVGAPGADRPDPSRGPSVTLEDAGACFLVERETATVTVALAPPDPAPMSLFGACCALPELRATPDRAMRSDMCRDKRRDVSRDMSRDTDLKTRALTHVQAVLVGHRYLEEESSRPSPGAALYTPP